MRDLIPRALRRGARVPSARAAVIAVLAAGLMFGTSGTAQTFAPEGAQPLSLGVARLVLGGALLALAARLTGRPGYCVPPIPWLEDSRFGRGSVGRAARAANFRLQSRSPWLPLLLVVLGAVCLVGCQATFFSGIERNGVAVGTVVSIASCPPVAGLLEWWLFRRRPSRKWLAATALAVVGVALLANLAGVADIPTDLLGVFLSVLSGAASAGYLVLVKALQACGWGATRAVTNVVSAGAALGLPVLLATDLSWLFTPAGLLVAAWLGVVTLLMASLLLSVGLRALSAATATTLGLVEPVLATLLGVLLLHEPLSLSQCLGIAGVVSGVLIAGRGERVERSHPRPTVASTP